MFDSPSGDHPHLGHRSVRHTAAAGRPCGNASEQVAFAPAVPVALRLDPDPEQRTWYGVKSLLSFATRMGYLPFNAGAAIHGPALEQKLAERILSERQVFALLEAVEDRPATTP